MRCNSALPFGLVVAIGAALRVWGLHERQLGIELQEHFARMAMLALGRGDWSPGEFIHGPLLTYVLRGLYGLAVGMGLVGDRLDALASFVSDPWPFVLAARLVIVVCALGSIVAVSRIAERLSGPIGGLAAAAVLATNAVHVRESHHVWLDLPTGFGAITTSWCALRAWDHPTTGRLVLMALIAAATVAVSWRGAPIVAIPLVVAVLAPAGDGPRWQRGLLVVIALALGFVACAPHVVWNIREAAFQVSVQSRISWVARDLAPRGLSLLDIGRYGFGFAVVPLLVLGAIEAVRRHPLPGLLVVGFPAVSFALLASASVVFARYFATLAPFAAVFAGVGIAWCAARLPPARRPIGIALLLAAACGPPALAAVQDVRLRSRPDTRTLAGAWITTHIAPGTPMTMPDLVPYLDPVMPLDAARLGFSYEALAPALRERGLGDPARTWPLRHITFFGSGPEDWTPRTPYVVTATHPAVYRGLTTSVARIEAIRAAGGVMIQEWRAIADDPPSRVVFDPLEAEPVPLAGFADVVRPGPNVQLWQLPNR